MNRKRIVPSIMLLALLALGAAPFDARVSDAQWAAVVAFLSAPCTAYCEDCTGPYEDYMWWTEISGEYNSTLDGFKDCPQRFIGPCDTFQNCSGGGSFLFTNDLAPADMLARIEAFGRYAATLSPAEARSLQKRLNGRVFLNEARGSLQALGCDGVSIALNIPIRGAATTELGE